MFLFVSIAIFAGENIWKENKVMFFYVWKAYNLLGSLSTQNRKPWLIEHQTYNYTKE